MACRQAGYTLLLMLTILLAGSAAVLSPLSDSNTASAFPAASVHQPALSDARQALLSYTSLYPFLYGPRGAGPGHLPCPDTDTSTQTGVQATAQVPAQTSIQTSTQVPVPVVSAADGPNPPCGSGSLASGRLARHVSLPGYRYLFHAERDQSIDYYVSTAFINNPVNRLVNDSIPHETDSGWPAPAWLELHTFAAGLAAPRSSVTPVTRKALMLAARPGVAAWLMSRANRRATDHCSPSPVALMSTTPTGLSQLLQLVSDRLTPSTSRLTDCPSLGPESFTLENTVLERVPARSHWFFRNAWQERIVIRISDTCATTEPDTCELVYQRPVQAARSGSEDARLLFNWQAR
jgi:hypothetical protein